MLRSMGRHPRGVWRLDRAGSEPDREVVVQRSKTVGQAVRSAGRTDIVVVHDGTAVRTFVCVPESPHAMTVVRALCAAVGASSAQVESLPDLSAVESVGMLRAVPQPAGSRETAAGADPLESASTLARELAPGEWLALSLRVPVRGETRRVRAWYRSRLSAQTHSTLDPEVLVASVTAGATTRERAGSHMTQVASAMPGFDIEVKPVAPRRWTASLILGAVTALVWIVCGLVTGWLAAALVASVPALATALDLSGFSLDPAWRLTRRARAGFFRSPPRRLLPARSPRPAGKDAAGAMIAGRPGDYPLASASFLFGPSVFIGVAAPRAEGMAGTTRLREPSPAILERIGPMVGTAGSREVPVYLSARDTSAGIALMGIPDSGKSVAVRLIYGWVCLERARPSGLPGWPGRASTVIAFENKGQGAARYAAWADSVGDRATIVEIADPSSLRIDMFAGPGSVRVRATRFIDHMVYAFGEGAIQGESTESLTAALQGALALPLTVVEQAGLGRIDHEIALAHAFTGGQGDEVGIRLFEALTTLRSQTPRTDPAFADLDGAAQSLAVYYGQGATASARRASMKAARNKLDQLASVGSWWSHARQAITWDEVLAGHGNIVVNAGVSASGHAIPDRLTSYMSAMLMHALKGAVSRQCSGWLAAGRSVWLFGDELKMLAESSAEVVEWVREAGREFGMKAVLATQRPDQLRPEVRSSVLGFGTMFWFSQNSAEIIDAAVRDLGTDGTTWTPADVAAIAAHHAIMRTTVDKHRQPGVPVRIAWFEDDLSRFAGAQGYPAVPAVSGDLW